VLLIFKHQAALELGRCHCAAVDSMSHLVTAVRSTHKVREVCCCCAEHMAWGPAVLCCAVALPGQGQGSRRICSGSRTLVVLVAVGFTAFRSRLFLLLQRLFGTACRWLILTAQLGCVVQQSPGRLQLRQHDETGAGKRVKEGNGQGCEHVAVPLRDPCEYACATMSTGSRTGTTKSQLQVIGPREAAVTFVSRQLLVVGCCCCCCCCWQCHCE
jgi:hypothetical protein